MDIRAHADMASMPMSSSTHSNFMQSGAPILQAEAGAAATGASNSASSTKLKINITTGSTRNANNNNGLSATQTPVTSAAGNGVNSANPNPNPNPNSEHHELKLPITMELKSSKKPVRYRECQKNHAANIGGHANDGCGEFMPSGEEGTIEALRCAACSCHRNFHRREVEGEEPASCDCRYGGSAGGGGGIGAASARDQHNHRKRLMEQGPTLYPTQFPMLPSPAGIQLHATPISTGGGGIGRTPPPPPHLFSAPPSQMIMAFNSHDPDDYETGLLSPHSSLKKRFRTKFTADQKEQMHAFAEKIGWRIQKQDEEAVQQFCADVGVKRHVLKVWMHNNKNTFTRKQSNSSQPNNSNTNDTINNNNTACISTASIGSEDEMRSS